MVTIYFDKQLFSHLFNAQEEKYRVLREKILSHRDEFIFLYSNAHLFDLQQDMTDIKYEEMDLMQTIVDGNHIFFENPNIMVGKETPRSVFDNIAAINDFSWLDNFDLSQITKEQREVINNIMDISYKDLTGQLEFDWLKKRAPICSNEVQIDKASFTSFVKFVKENFYDNKNSYKQIRDNAIKNYNPALITTDCESIFNNQLASSPLGLSFIETIKATINQVGLPTSDASTVYYISYMLLDLLGVSREARKKVKFRNMQTDCMHSFFGSYCDCFVSDDVGIIRKSKTLYNLFNFETTIYSIDEFITKFDEAIKNNQKSAYVFLEEIRNDYQQRKVVKEETSAPYILTQLVSTHKYFGYFNHMLERKSKDETVIILYKNHIASQLLLIQEIEIIVNRLVHAFNDLGAAFGLFNRDTEMPQIKAGNWGRVLRLDDADIGLTTVKDPFRLCLWIKPKPSALQ